MSKEPRPGPALPAADLPFSHPHRVASLPGKKPLHFDLIPDAATRARIALALGLIDLPYLRLTGEVCAAGRHDFALQAALVAQAVQPCSLTLAPVPAQISEAVTRRYVADFEQPEGDEAEMPADDSIEPLPEVIDLGAVAVEALALALPLYPRAPGAELAVAVFAPPGAEPLQDADLKPFAGLGALKLRVQTPDEGA